MQWFKRRQTTPETTYTEPVNRVPYTTRCIRCGTPETETVPRYSILCRSCRLDVQRYTEPDTYAWSCLHCETVFHVDHINGIGLCNACWHALDDVLDDDLTEPTVTLALSEIDAQIAKYRKALETAQTYGFRSNVYGSLWVYEQLRRRIV